MTASNCLIGRTGTWGRGGSTESVAGVGVGGEVSDCGSARSGLRPRGWFADAGTVLAATAYAPIPPVHTEPSDTEEEPVLSLGNDGSAELGFLSVPGLLGGLDHRNRHSAILRTR